MVRWPWASIGLGLAAALAAGCLDPTGVGAPGSSGDEGGSDLDLGPLAGVPVASENAASFVTWNLKTFPLTDRTVRVVSEVLGDWQDDVVAVQEITDVVAFKAMVDALPGYSAVLNDDPGGMLRLGLVVADDRVELSNVQTLFADDPWAFPRPSLRADVTIHLRDIATVDFTVIVVHLKSQVGTGTQARRRAAAEALANWIETHAGIDADEDIVVLGDFNEDVVGAGPDGAFETFLARPEAYRFVTYDLNAAAGFSQLSYQSFIDHILITSKALDEYGAGETVVVDMVKVDADYEETVSDHLPVRAVFAPRAARRAD